MRFHANHNRGWTAIVTIVSLLSLASPAPAAAGPDGASTADSPAVQPQSTDVGSITSSSEFDEGRIGDDWRWRPHRDGWLLPLDFLGWGRNVSFRPADPTALIDLPIGGDGRPRIPTAVEFDLVAADFVDEVDVTVLLGSREIHSSTHDGGSRSRIRIPVAVASGDQLTIATEAHLPPGCGVGERAWYAQLIEPTLAFAEDRSPAAHLSDPVTVIRIGVENGRSTHADEAALKAASVLAEHLVGHQRVEVTELSDLDAPGSPFMIKVAVLEREQTGIRLNGRTIEILGRTDELVLQAHGLAEALGTLTSGELVRVESAAASQPFTAETRRPVTEIPGARLADYGARHLEVGLPLAPSEFGYPVAEFDIRLGGVVSPASPADLGGSQLSLWLDNELVEVVPVDEHGRFDLEHTLQGDLVGRQGDLRLEFDAALDECGQVDLYHLQIDPGSWVLGSAGQPLPPSLGRFPQVATEGWEVQPGRQPWELGAAADLLVLFQEESGRTVDITVGETPGGTPLLVVNPDVETQEQLGAPMNARLGRLDTGEARLQSDARLAIPFGLQGFESPDGRDVLMLESNELARGGIPDAVAEHGLRPFAAAAVTLSDKGVIAVSGVQQSRGVEPSLLPTRAESSHEQPRSAGSNFFAGLVIAALGGGIWLLYSKLRHPLPRH